MPTSRGPIDKSVMKILRISFDRNKNAGVSNYGEIVRRMADRRNPKGRPEEHAERMQYTSKLTGQPRALFAFNMLLEMDPDTDHAPLVEAKMSDTPSRVLN